MRYLLFWDVPLFNSVLDVPPEDGDRHFDVHFLLYNLLLAPMRKLLLFDTRTPLS